MAIDTVKLGGYCDFLKRRRAKRKENKRQKKIDAGYKYAQEEIAYLAGNWIKPEGFSNGIYFQQGYEQYHDQI